MWATMAGVWQKLRRSVRLAAVLLFLVPESAWARTSYLPDYVVPFGYRINNRGAGGDIERLCSHYGYADSCESPKMGTPRQNVLPGKTCWENCHCPSIYQYDESNCQPPYYVGYEQCDGKYLSCEEDLDRACAEFEKSCQEGYRLGEPFCEYSNDYGTCCNLCEGYDYDDEMHPIPAGYEAAATCQACGGVTKYTIQKHDCGPEYKLCEYQGALDAQSCRSGEDILYTACRCPDNCQASCPDGYICMMCGSKYCPTGCAMDYAEDDEYWCAVPSQECRNLGYKRTSCDSRRGSLTCPFDRSLHLCLSDCEPETEVSRDYYWCAVPESGCEQLGYEADDEQCDGKQGKIYCPFDRNYVQCSPHDACTEAEADGTVFWCGAYFEDCRRLGYDKTPSQCPEGYDKAYCPFNREYVACGRKDICEVGQINSDNYWESVPETDCGLLGYDREAGDCEGMTTIYCPFDKGRAACWE